VIYPTHAPPFVTFPFRDGVTKIYTAWSSLFVLRCPYIYPHRQVPISMGVGNQYSNKSFRFVNVVDWSYECALGPKRSPSTWVVLAWGNHPASAHVGFLRAKPISLLNMQSGAHHGINQWNGEQRQFAIGYDRKTRYLV
jgi:hypothetical protein